MRVSDAMTRDVRVVNPEQTLCDVAKIMAECDVGSVPVGENDKLVGMITDRDIAVRAVAQGKSPDATRVREIMTQDIKYCFEDEEVAHVARNMGDIQVHRLPVVNADKRLVGIVSLADIAMCEGAEMAGQAVAGICTPTGSPGPTAGSLQQQQQPSGSYQQAGRSQSGGAGSRQQQQQPSGSAWQAGGTQQQRPSGSSQQQQQPSGGQQQPGGTQQQRPSGSSQQQQQPSGGQQQPGGAQRQRPSGSPQQQQQPSGGQQQPGGAQQQRPSGSSQQQQQPSGSYQQTGGTGQQPSGSRQQEQQPSGSRQSGSSQQSSGSRRQQS